MNDFTKDELNLILQLCVHRAESISGVEFGRQGYGKLFDKTKYMIDNYHEIKLPTMATYCCQKCNEEWNKCECKK